MRLHTYLPQDRLRALVAGRELPSRCEGAALFADVSGFTALTEKLSRQWGERRGIEALSQRINEAYEALIGEVDRWGGSVIGFSGDAILCWFDVAPAATDTTAVPSPCATGAPRAVACAWAMQAAMHLLPDLEVKVAVCSGPARRWVLGEESIQRIDVLAGPVVEAVAQAEGLAQAGEVIVDEATAAALPLQLAALRRGPNGQRLHVLGQRQDAPWLQAAAAAALALVTPSASTDANANSNAKAADLPTLPALWDAEALRPWLLPFVFERETAAQGLFTTDLRPTVALFLRFRGWELDAAPEQAQSLPQLIALAQRLVAQQGGVLLELTLGDKGSFLYANFGAAVAHEDDAVRALKAAQALRQAFADRGCTVQIGLSSGTMRVGAYGSATRQSFGAIGDDTNFAARLMVAAQDGEILASGRVRQAAAQSYVLEPRPPLPLKGKAQPMPVFAVLGAREHRATRLQEPTPALPMVGREAQTQQFQDQLRLAQSGRGQVLAWVAEAGMGKSRLVSEAIRLARRARFTGYGGSCGAGGGSAAYAVWRDIACALIGLDAEMPQRKRQRAILAAVEDAAPEHAEAWPVLGPLLGLELADSAFTAGLGPKDRKALLEQLLLRCLQGAALEAAEDGGGLLLVLEDVHQADALSLDLLAQVVRAGVAWPLMLILSYRPTADSAAAASLAALQALPHFHQVELAGLDLAQTEQVVRTKLAALYPERPGDVAPELVQALAQRAQGNPFYIEELLNYLHDRGIDPHHGAAVQALQWPASLHSLVLSRMDQLAAPQQRVLKVASVVGRSFGLHELCEYHPALGTQAQLQPQLQTLAEQGFTPLQEAAPAWRYVFKHLVSQEVAYQSLSQADRRLLHGQYASHLERRLGSADKEAAAELLSPLAHHFGQAEVVDRAARYGLAAAEQAAAQFANRRALAAFAQALNWLPQSAHAERLSALLRCEAIEALLGEREAQRQTLARCSQLARQAGMPALAALQVQLRQARLALELGDEDAATQTASRVVQRLRALGGIEEGQGMSNTDNEDSDESTASGSSRPARSAVESDGAAALLVDALLLQARAALAADKAALVLAPLEQALALARQQGYAAGEYNALAQWGVLAWRGGDHAQAEALFTQALQRIQQAGDVRRELDLLNNLGVVHKSRAQFDRALQCLLQAQQIARRIGDRSGEATLLNNMGSGCLAAQDFVSARQHSEAAMRLFAELGEDTQRALAQANLAEAHRGLGQYRIAEDIAQQALAQLRATGARRGEAIVLENLGLLHWACGDLAQAEARLTAARALAQEIAAPFQEGSSLLHLALLWCDGQRWDAVEQALADLPALWPAMTGAEPDALRALVQAQWALHAAAQADGSSTAALEALQSLWPQLLPGEPDSGLAPLPLALHLRAAQALQVCGDGRAAAVWTHAQNLLQERSARIKDAALRRDFLQIATHQALAKQSL